MMRTGSKLTPAWLTFLVTSLLLTPVALAQDDERPVDEGAPEEEQMYHTMGGNHDGHSDGENGTGDGDSNPDDDAEHRDADEERRKVKVDVTADRALFKLEKEANASSEEVKLDYQADEGRLKLEFKEEAHDSESGFEYKVELERLVEYVDLNGNGTYEEGVDTLVSAFKIDEEMEWTVLGVEDITHNGTPGKKVTAEGTFRDATGKMQVVFYAYGDFADLEGTTLRPTDVKFDFIIIDYPYGHNESRLALEIKAKYEAEYEGAGNATGLQASAGNVSGYFTWADWALVDGNRTAVIPQVFREEIEAEEGGAAGEMEHKQRLYLNYARGTHILHDPVIGVAYSAAAPTTDTSSGDTNTGSQDSQPKTSSPPPSAATPGPGLLAAVAAGAIAAAFIRRRNP